MYKHMLMKCSQHGIVEWMQIQIFYNRLNVAIKHMLHVVAGGSLSSKQPDVAQNLIDEMATNGYQWSSERNKAIKAAGIYKVDILTIWQHRLKQSQRGWTLWSYCHKFQSWRVRHRGRILDRAVSPLIWLPNKLNRWIMFVKITGTKITRIVTLIIWGGGITTTFHGAN